MRTLTATAILTLLVTAASAQDKRSVALPDATIAYTEAGDPEGAPVIFVHGLPFSSYIWRDVMGALDGSGRRLIALDLVGFGDSEGVGAAVDDQAAHLAGFVEALGLTDVTLVGHDWGAGIALMYAAQNPDTVAAFAFFEGAMPPVYPRPAYGEMPERMAGMFRSMREPGVAEERVLADNLWLETIMPTMTAEPLPEAVRAVYLRPFPDAQSRAPLLAMSRSLPIGGEPAEVVAAYEAADAWWRQSPIPKLVIYAEPGRLFPETMARWTEKNVANVTLANIGPGTHALQEEAPEAVAAALADWLATLPAK